MQQAAVPVIDQSIFQSDRFITMQNKMQQHFSSKQEEAEAQSIRLLGEMDSLVKDIKISREGFSKDNSGLEE